MLTERTPRTSTGSERTHGLGMRPKAVTNDYGNKVDYSAGHDEPGAIDPVFSGVLQEALQLALVRQ